MLVSGNDGQGLEVTATGTAVYGAIIGLDATASTDLPNGRNGIRLNGATDAIIGAPGAGNIVSGNNLAAATADGIYVNGGSGHTIQSNLIGTNAAGASFGNYAAGIALSGAATVTIGGSGASEGNVISANGANGVRISGVSSTGNKVEGNTIGLNPVGDAALGNSAEGISVEGGASSNTIGGSTAAHGNVISGNGSGDAGILVIGAGSDNNVIRNNYIGTNAAGDGAIANNLHGIRIENAAGTQILDNLISGNDVHGVYVYDTAATGTQILRNTIGTNAAETAAVPNLFDGIRLEGGSSGTIIGTAGNGNVISGNGQQGITINDNNGNTIQGNFIGTDSGATEILGNGDGGVFNEAFGSSNNLIGGDGPGEGNVIAHNDVGILLESGNNNAIVGNDIYSNTNLGIDLDPVGVTENDGGDGDGGPNGRLNFPVITSAAAAAGSITVGFDLDVPNGSYRVEFFNNPGGADPTGNGEGEAYVDFVDVSVTGGVPTPASTSIPGATGDVLTATATAGTAVPFGSTSEFSDAYTATAGGGSEIAGTVFEDIAGELLNDGTIGDANNPGSPDVDVYLYEDTNGNNVLNIGTGDTLIAGPVATDGSGNYSFGSQPDNTYFVFVDSRGIPSAQDPGAAIGDVWAVQTYGPAGGVCATGGGSSTEQGSAGSCYGGITSLFSDTLSLPIHRARIVLSGADRTDVDFGFSFNVVVGTEGGDNSDDDGGNPRTVQGSLRQFIQNANAISGANSMRFVPVDPANESTWWEIAVSNDLPPITGANTAIDGTAYQLADGVTIRNTNTGFLGANAAGGITVGVGDVALPQVAAPELEIDSSGVTDNGLEVRADNVTIRALAIYGFGSTGTALTDGDIAVPSGFAVGGLTVEENVIGTSAGSFTDPGAALRSDGSGVAIQDVTGAQSTIQNNLFGYFDELAVSILNSDNVVVSGNESRNVGQGANIFVDAMSAENGSSNVEFRGNLIDGAPGNGISLWQSSGSHLVRNNTINNVGSGGAQTAAVAVFGTGSTVDLNIITGNSGPAVLVVGENPAGGAYSWPTATGNRISQNTFGSNSGVAIDLTESSDDEVDHEQGDGVTLTAGTDGTTGNNGVDAPVVTLATPTTAGGTACGDCEIEIYRAVSGAGDGGYGEGVAYLGTTTADGAGNWIVAGLTGLVVGDHVSAIAIDSSDTSEFGANLAVAAGALVVNSVGDAGDNNPGNGICDTGGPLVLGNPECTLRAAIEEANVLAGADDIHFDIPGAGPHTISPGTALDTIAQPLTLDATTEPDFSGTPVVQLEGSTLVAFEDGLRVDAADVTIRGFVIGAFPGDGIEVGGSASGTVIAGNYIGTNVAGTAGNSNARGIDLGAGSGPTTVGGTLLADRNLISGNAAEGITIWDSDGNIIIGNYIGTAITGNAPLPNGDDGIRLGGGSDSNVIGQAASGNVISGNGEDAVEITDNSTGNVLHDNMIGIGRNGSTRSAQRSPRSCPLQRREREHDRRQRPRRGQRHLGQRDKRHRHRWRRGRHHSLEHDSRQPHRHRCGRNAGPRQRQPRRPPLRWCNRQRDRRREPGRGQPDFRQRFTRGPARRDRNRLQQGRRQPDRDQRRRHRSPGQPNRRLYRKRCQVEHRRWQRPRRTQHPLGQQRGRRLCHGCRHGLQRDCRQLHRNQHRRRRLHPQW